MGIYSGLASEEEHNPTVIIQSFEPESFHRDKQAQQPIKFGQDRRLN